MKRRHSVCIAQASTANVVACLALVCVPAAGIAADLSASPMEAAYASAPLARGAVYGQPQREPRAGTRQRPLRARTEVISQGDHSGHTADDRTGETGGAESMVRARYLGPALALVSGALVIAVWLTGRGRRQKTGAAQDRPVTPGPMPNGSTERTDDGVRKAASDRAALLIETGADTSARTGVVAPLKTDARTSAKRGVGKESNDDARKEANDSGRSASNEAEKEATDHAGTTAPNRARKEAQNRAGKAPKGTASGVPNGATNQVKHGARRDAKNAAGKAAKPPVVAAAPLRLEPGLSSDASAALGYVSIREPDAADEGELRIQMAVIDAACQDRSLALKEVVRDVEHGDDTGPARPGIEYALRRLAGGDASCLVVAELGRLSRSTTRLGYILEWLRRREARLVSVDEGLDTATRSGREAAKRLASRYVSEGRPPARLAQTGRGPHPAVTGNGRRRLASVDRSVLKERIREMRASGMTLQAIADLLNEERVPTLRGGAEWRPSAVQSVTGNRRPDPSGSGENDKGTVGEGRDLRDISPVAREEARDD
jgi:DNA invertase Pin-like site-specific DNA recombinase